MEEKNVENLTELQPVRLKYDGRTYTLRFTRKTVERLEQSGYSREAFGAQPLTMAGILFYYAFTADHPSVTKKKTDEIMTHIPNLMDLLKKLMELADAPALALFTDPEDDEEGPEKNATWTQ